MGGMGVEVEREVWEKYGRSMGVGEVWEFNTHRFTHRFMEVWEFNTHRLPVNTRAVKART